MTLASAILNAAQGILFGNVKINIFCGSFEKDNSNIAKWPRYWQTTWMDLFVLLMGPSPTA